ncbi:MAG TPA: hypothetical protein DEQ38_02975 [Elusimicrobia bacterium]|nr:MAG: hypothetical protein A2089_07220 [Elusimicrobia bacterium GWD2_63_28]HCC47069.1 hypothetical protein [Elusimicrobiota bacterium]
MFLTLLALALAGFAAWCVRNHMNKGGRDWLTYAGYALMPLTFVLTMKAGASAVLHGGSFKIFAALFLFTGLTYVLLRAGSDGTGNAPLWLTLAMFIGTLSIAISLEGYRGMIIKHHATGECRKVVAECSSGILPRLPAPKKQEAVEKMTAALAATSDHYTRIGLICNLYYVPAEAQAALPAVIPLIADADPDTLGYILKLLDKMGTGAADAAPAVAARIAGRTPRESTYELEATLKKITPQQNLTGHGPVLSGS